MTVSRTTEYVYSDDRLSLAQEIAEGLRVRGLWVPQEWAGPDLITAVFRAIDARDAVLVEALEGAVKVLLDTLNTRRCSEANLRRLNVARAALLSAKGAP